jgi:hypothetical protein
MASNAEHAHNDQSTPGTMDISENLKTWNAFWNVSKYCSVAILVLAALLFFFRTHNG